MAHPAETAHLYYRERKDLAQGISYNDAQRIDAGQVATVGAIISTSLAGVAAAAYTGGATPNIDYSAVMWLVENDSNSIDAVKFTLDGSTPVAGGLGMTLEPGKNVWLTQQEFLEAKWIDDAAGGATLRAQGFRAA